MQIEAPAIKIGNPVDIAKILTGVLNNEDENDRLKEHFWAIGIDSNNRIVYLELVSLGSLDAAIVEPRETFRLAVLKRISRILVAHNHPSGNLEPSDKDKQVTQRLIKAGEILGIEVLDHIIVELSGEYKSFSESGLMNKENK